MDTVPRILETLDGNIQCHGLKVKFKNWMVMGSDEWNSTPDTVKSYAYQVAKKWCGWTDGALKNILIATFPYIDKNMAEFTISELQHLADTYPLENSK
jgi:6-phosphogluconolactonase/glucosamine-6-phosphate isomerase/deaminase